MDLHSLTQARQTAAEILATAALDLFPGTLLLQGQGTDKIFFYDFIFPSEFSKDSLPLLEERMRLVSKQKPQIKTLEMTPKNAAARMAHQGQSWLGENLKRVEATLVQMIQIGDFVDWCEAPFEEAWDPRLVFKLIESDSFCVENRKVVRIIGALFADKAQLKAWIKNAPIFAEISHRRLCQRLKLLAPSPSLGEGLFVWLPRGETFRQALLSWWEKAHRKQNFELITTPASLIGEETNALIQAHTEISNSFGFTRLAEVSYFHEWGDFPRKEGLLEAKGWMEDRAHIFSKDEELLNSCISSLQFIIKIPKILGFEFQIVLYTRKGRGKGCSPLREALEQMKLPYSTEYCSHSTEKGRIAVRLPDALGRWWDASFLSISSLSRSGQMLLTRSTFGSLERLVALLLEQKGGELPVWLSLFETINAIELE